MATVFVLVVFAFLNNVYCQDNQADSSVRELTAVLAKVIDQHAKTDKDFAAAVAYLGSPNLRKMYKALRDTVEFKMVEVYLSTLGFNSETQIFDIQTAIEALYSKGITNDSANVTFASFNRDLFKAMPPKRMKKCFGDIFLMDRYVKICRVAKVKNVETLIVWVQYTPVYWALVHEFRKVDLDLHAIVRNVLGIASKHCRPHKPRSDDLL